MVALAPACSLDAMSKVGCVIPSDCLAGYICEQQICIRSDAGTADPTGGDGQDARPDLAEPITPPIIFVAATADDGGLWLFEVPSPSVGSIVANLAPAIDVLAKAGGGLTRVDDAEVQGLGRQVFILARTGTTAHVASVRDGSWTAWQPLATDVSAMALANWGGSLWACLVGDNGRLRLMSRAGDGIWQDQGDVMDQASIPSGDAPAGLLKVDCTGIGSDLQVFALDRMGHLWQTTKGAAAWIPFRRVVEAGDAEFVDIDTCNAAGDLHVLASLLHTQWHEVVPANGAPTGFSDIERHTGDPMGSVVAGALASMLTEVEWMQLNSLGEISDRHSLQDLSTALRPARRVVAGRAPVRYPVSDGRVAQLTRRRLRSIGL